jgi:hypothetical protein
MNDLTTPTDCPTVGGHSSHVSCNARSAALGRHRRLSAFGFSSHGVPLATLCSFLVLAVRVCNNMCVCVWCVCVV